jgi:predicted ATPase
VQLGELRRVWDCVLAGESRMLLVCGEAGVGKTRLVREFARQAHQRGAVVLHGRCDEDVAIALRPIRECLTHYLTSVPQGRLAGHDRRGLRELTRLVPELAQRLPELPDPTRTDPQAKQYLLFSAVAGLLGEIAADGRAVVLVTQEEAATTVASRVLRLQDGVLAA